MHDLAFHRVATAAIILVALTTPALRAADGSVSAQSEQFTGTVNVRFESAGVRVSLDVSDSQSAPDGVTDREFFLMREDGPQNIDASIDIENAWVRSTPQALQIVSSDRQFRLVLRLEEDGEPAMAVADTTEADHPRSTRRPAGVVRTINGYGLRSAIMAPADAALPSPASGAGDVAANAACDAGGDCGASQCSLTCGTSSCSTTCISKYSACCRCITANLASCSCGFCTR